MRLWVAHKKDLESQRFGSQFWIVELLMLERRGSYLQVRYLLTSGEGGSGFQIRDLLELKEKDSWSQGQRCTTSARRNVVNSEAQPVLARTYACSRRACISNPSSHQPSPNQTLAHSLWLRRFPHSCMSIEVVSRVVQSREHVRLGDA